MDKNIVDLIKSRRSVRSYKEEQVKKEEIETILEGGIWAPSGTNEQSWHFTVIQNKELINELSDNIKKVLSKSTNEYMKKLGDSENFNIFYKAPTVILVSGEEKALTPLEDTSASVENMLLIAESLSVGTCWIGTVSALFADKELGEIYREKCKIPKGYNVMHGIAVGYQKSGHLTPPKRKENKINYVE